MNKEAVRKWMEQRAKVRAPIPSQEEIKRQLGFGFNPKSNDRQR